MAKEAESRIQKFGRDGMHVYIPATVRSDSQNPLKVGDTVLVSVDGQKMTIERKEIKWDMDSQILQHLPSSFQVWQKIENEAQKRAEARYQEILRKANDGNVPPSEAGRHDENLFQEGAQDGIRSPKK
jgi:hypothetical protein